jgi:hypothetical protein
LGYDSSRLRQEMQRKLSQNYTWNGSDHLFMPWLRYEDNIKNIIFLDSVELRYDRF